MSANVNRPVLSDPGVLQALSHPVRLDVLDYLMASGPATASECARAVGDSPSNCSYHLRVLGSHGLVEPVDSSDGRTRPWRATITGFTMDVGSDEASEAGAAALLAASMELDAHLGRDYVRHRNDLPPEWRAVDSYASYGLRVTPPELTDLLARLDALIRPFIAPTRGDAPDDARTVHLSVAALPRTGFDRS
ncbi:MAG: Transcriptional regulator, ArsR family [Frondihabitans sp.]|nr:Transcriptional regulator, ArsR family [Frondihabitans sp.]